MSCMAILGVLVGEDDGSENLPPILNVLVLLFRQRSPVILGFQRVLVTALVSFGLGLASASALRV